VVAHATAQHAVPSRSREDTQDPKERIGNRKTEEGPKVTQSKKSEITQTNRESGPLRGQGWAEIPRANDTGANDLEGRNADIETATESDRREPGKLLMKPHAHLPLEVTEDDHCGRRKVWYTPLSQ
jgi:hypothetical protein